MPPTVRKTDVNSAGAPVLQGQENFIIENLPVSVNGMPVQGHAPGVHASPITANGSKSFIVNNIPVNVLGDPDSCGHPRAEGAKTFIVVDD